MAVALLPARERVQPAHIALVLTVTVVAVASFGSRPSALAAAASAALAFNLIHTQPYWTLRIRHAADVLTAVLLLGVGTVVGELAVRARRAQWEEAELRRDVEQLDEVAEMVATGLAPVLVVVEVNRALTTLLGLRDCRFDIGSWWLTAPAKGRLDVDGEVTVDAKDWDTDAHGLPSVELELVAMCQGNVVGRYVLDPLPGNLVRPEHRKTAVALAAQAGAAIVLGSP